LRIAKAAVTAAAGHQSTAATVTAAMAAAAATVAVVEVVTVAVAGAAAAALVAAAGTNLHYRWNGDGEICLDLSYLSNVISSLISCLAQAAGLLK
jgi:hypothetical protein